MPALPARENGRPSEYDPAYIETIKRLAPLGATDRQLAILLNVSVPTINAWKKDHPEFLKSIQEQRQELDREIAYALYRAARAGDVKAMLAWLRNRDPENWRDRREVTHSGQITLSLDPAKLDQLTPDQRNALLRKLEEVDEAMRPFLLESPHKTQ